MVQSYVTLPQKCTDLLCQHSFAICLILYTHCPTLEYVQPNILLQLSMFGPMSIRTSGGLSYTFTAKEPRFTGTRSTITLPDAQFDQVHIDLVGPLPTSQGYTYILTCIDQFTHWPEAIPILDITAEGKPNSLNRCTAFGIAGYSNCIKRRPSVYSS